MTRLAFLLADLPVELLGRMRSDRVLYFPPPPQPAGKRGRKPKRGAEFAFEVAATQPVPSVTTVTDTTHYGKAVATAWDRLHPLLVRRSAWADHPEGELPVIEGTVIRLHVDHLRGDLETAALGRSGRMVLRPRRAPHITERKDMHPGVSDMPVTAVRASVSERSPPRRVTVSLVP